MPACKHLWIASLVLSALTQGCHARWSTGGKAGEEVMQRRAAEVAYAKFAKEHEQLLTPQEIAAHIQRMKVEAQDKKRLLKHEFLQRQSVNRRDPVKNGQYVRLAAKLICVVLLAGFCYAFNRQNKGQHDKNAVNKNE
ncbi:hypothetical protein JKP88DRAFT_262141 [Tribonema minus]|uniref:Uncharacterized protein n=1 Tax=Tribonema minus TaxID=303371 RepID=A0A835Z9I3_9STRA|nr:hypothetical protein JKP88DRAFT_262141 [Tribonema minus]